METAILVIDMINEYADEHGKIFCPAAPSIVKHLNRLIKFGRKKGWPIVFVNTELRPVTISDHSVPDDTENLLVRKWGLQAVTGTWACEVIHDLEKHENDHIVTKTSFDGFYSTTLESTLRNLGVRNVIVTGIHTHVCVFFTAMSAAIRGFNVIAIEECMTTGFRENHDTRLRMYQTHIGELYRLEEFLNRRMGIDD